MSKRKANLAIEERVSWLVKGGDRTIGRFTGGPDPDVALRYAKKWLKRSVPK